MAEHPVDRIDPRWVVVFSFCRYTGRFLKFLETGDPAEFRLMIHRVDFPCGEGQDVVLIKRSLYVWLITAGAGTAMFCGFQISWVDSCGAAFMFDSRGRGRSLLDFMGLRRFQSRLTPGV